jgi:hypothetical protein
VRVQVLTNAGALERDKQLAVVGRFTGMIAEAGRDPSLAERTWVLLTEATLVAGSPGPRTHQRGTGDGSAHAGRRTPGRRGWRTA